MTAAQRLNLDWQAANARLAELTAAGVKENDSRVQELLGRLDAIEHDAGVLERKTPPEDRGVRRG